MWCATGAKGIMLPLSFRAQNLVNMKWEYCRVIFKPYQMRKKNDFFSKIIHLFITSMTSRDLAWNCTSFSRKPMLVPNLLRVVSD